MKKIIKPKIKQEGTFILKLFNILKDKRFSKYIYWSQDGKSFIIPNKKKFTKNVIPKFCNTQNYSSFVRQLNLYDFKKIKTVDRAIQKYKHKEFNESKGEEEIKLIKKPDRKSDKEEEKSNQKNNNMFGKIIGGEAKEEDLNSLEKIEKKDEESKLKDYINILQKGCLSNASNEKILKYLLDISKKNIENNNYIEEELKNLIIQNNKLMETIEIFKNALNLQNENIKKKNLLIAYLILLLLNKIIESKKNLGENKKKKQLQKYIFYKIKNYRKKKKLKISENKDINSLKSSISSEKSSIIVNDIILLNNHNILNNSFYKNEL